MMTILRGTHEEKCPQEVKSVDEVSLIVIIVRDSRGIKRIRVIIYKGTASITVESIRRLRVSGLSQG